MTATLPSSARLTEPAAEARQATRHSFLMAPPTQFTVTYAINAWMDTTVPVDSARAVAQWEALRATYERLGHAVHVLDAQAGLPDMVFAANGAFSVDGVVYGARFAYAERGPEARAHQQWYEEAGWTRFVPPTYVNEGEGDFTYVPGPGLILAGHGFRTDIRAHAEAAAVLDRRVVSLQLVDPRFYHLDTALFVLDDDNICYFPEAFSLESRSVLRTLFPDALLASQADAHAFGLNSVSDGHTVVVPAPATGVADAVERLGFTAIPVDLSELLKGGGSVKCCTAELRSAN
jgi:N-dimethylarginine dimethylaminohydrolase